MSKGDRIIDPKQQPLAVLHQDLTDFRQVRAELTAPWRMQHGVSSLQLAKVEGAIEVIEAEIQARALKN